MVVRDACSEDYPAFARFWDQLISDQRVPDAETWNRTLRPSTLFFAEGDELVAYALIFPFGPRGDVRQIVVDRAWRRRGVGRELMATVATRLRSAGCREWRLEVRADNAAAIALYHTVGMRELHAIETFRLAADAAAKLAPVRSERVRVIDPADDAELEAHFDYGPGQLASWRARRPVMWMLRDGARIALAGFVPDFAPDCALLFPFRATTADAARELLSWATPLPGQVELLVVDPPVSAMLRAVGAVLHESLIEMGGPL